jgi:hypothetical protein
MKAERWCVAGLLWLSACGASPEMDTRRQPPALKTPRAPDEGLLGSPGVSLDDDDALAAWVDARVAAAKAGHHERVRVPLAAPPPFTEGAAPFGLAAAWPYPDSRAVAIIDLTSIGIQPGPEGWAGWVEGRFTGERDDAGRAILEVRAQTPRGPDEAPLYRVVE